MDYAKTITAINDLPNEPLEVFRKKILKPTHIDMDWNHTPFWTDDKELSIILNVELITPLNMKIDDSEIIKLLLDFVKDTNPNIINYKKAVKELIRK